MKKGTKSLGLTAEQIRNLNPRKLKQYILEGKNREEIARICGVSKKTINSRLMEYGIKRLYTK